MAAYRYAYIPLKKGARPENDSKVRSGSVVGENSTPGGSILATADGSDPCTCRESDLAALPTEMTRDELMRAGACEANVCKAERNASTWAENSEVRKREPFSTRFGSVPADS